MSETNSNINDKLTVKYVKHLYGEEQAKTVIREYWTEFGAKLPEVMQTLFNVKPKKLAISNDCTFRAEYHTVYEVVRNCNKNISYVLTINSVTRDNTEYGYYDSAGSWHHSHFSNLHHYDTRQENGRTHVNCKHASQYFGERTTNSPLLHRWIEQDRQQTFICSPSLLLDKAPKDFNATVTNFSQPNWAELESRNLKELANAVRMEIQTSNGSPLFGTVGFSDSDVDAPSERRALLWPFYFGTYNINGHTFTVRVDGVNGFVNLYLDNPEGVCTPNDVNNARIASLNRSATVRNNYATYGLGFAFASFVIPYIFTILSLIYCIKALKNKCGRGKAVVGIIIAIVACAFYTFFVVYYYAVAAPNNATALLSLMLY